MPIYEYECEKCGYAFEREQRISDAPVKTCPKCKGRRVKKLISLTSFSLKGGGWYADGYSDSKSAKSDASDNSTSASADKPITSTTDGTKSDSATKKTETAKPASDTKKAKKDKSAA